MNGIECAFTGRAVRDPEFRMVKDGTLPMWSVTLAVEQKDTDAQFVRVTTFGERAETLNGEAIAKGPEVYVEGRLTLNTWTKDGESKSGLSVVATRVEVLGRIGKRRPRQARGNGRQQGNGQDAYRTLAGTAQADFDDAIPF